MNLVVESRIVGTFLGYAPGAVHRLDDGSEWEQVGNAREYVYRERPACRILRDQDRLFLDVEGTGGIAEVRQFMGKRWSGSGAYRASEHRRTPRARRPMGHQFESHGT